MGDVYTSVELGTDTIKVVTVEKMGDIYNVLAATTCESKGIKNGQISDIKAAASSVSTAVEKVNQLLGIKINKVIAAISPVECKMDIVVGSTDIISETEITGKDVSAVLKNAIEGHKAEGYEIITVSPISFMVDDIDNIKNPKGMRGTTLEAKVVISSIPKEKLYAVLDVIKQAGLKLIDVAFTSTGDYYTVRNKESDSSVGAIINIGESSTNISIFNKGIQIKHSIIPVGSVNVDKDLTYIYPISIKDARSIKENFAFALESLTDEAESINVKCTDNSIKELKQAEVSEVVEARLKEILKLSKNEIKNLTNREIRYIIVTGGLSELQGFNYLLDSNFNGLAKVCEISNIGIRHNKYSSTFGVFMYFDEKLLLREKTYNMIDSKDKEILTSTENGLSNYGDFYNLYSCLFD